MSAAADLLGNQPHSALEDEHNKDSEKKPSLYSINSFIKNTPSNSPVQSVLCDLNLHRTEASIEYVQCSECKCHWGRARKSTAVSKLLRHVKHIVTLVILGSCILAILRFHTLSRIRIPAAPSTEKSDQTIKYPISLESIVQGEWLPEILQIEWTQGIDCRDGLYLNVNGSDKGFLVIEDVQYQMEGPHSEGNSSPPKILMKEDWFTIPGSQKQYRVDQQWISPDTNKVLLMTGRDKVFRHSQVGLYYILDVTTGQVEPLDSRFPDQKVQLAQWAPTSNHIAFTRANNLFLRTVNSQHVHQITYDGGSDCLYGIPDWVYEEEVFANPIGAWWAPNGKRLVFLRTNETAVPEFPVEYYFSRPGSDKTPYELDDYPFVRRIKYPMVGAPNPIIDILAYEIEENKISTLSDIGIELDRSQIITSVIWAGNEKVIIRKTNRVSDFVKYVLVTMPDLSVQTLRTMNMTVDSNDWFEPAQRMIYVPADPSKGRFDDGYIDTVVFQGYDHLAYYSPLNNSKPVMLTQGRWEVDKAAPIDIDLENNIVYFVAAKEGPGERHVYSVRLDSTDLSALVTVEEKAYWTFNLSPRFGYIHLTNHGPGVPYQKLISTKSNNRSISVIVQDNEKLANKSISHDMPTVIYGTVKVGDADLPYRELRPSSFDRSRKYPVLFYYYGSPGSQTVSQRFEIDFQSYVASSLGYIVVSVDGRGSGYRGQATRSIIRNRLGHYEAQDQIAAAKIWARKQYINPNCMAIWGWSFGGFMALKVLESDAGQTFKYGMAVAPVTDWRFYDSIYTERYMALPQENKAGYDETAISNITALSQSVRFLVMHGTADDNVHTQNTLALLDALDLQGVDNYDMHYYPDSDHAILFHNANIMVYQRLSKWLVNAFNGEWLRIANPVPHATGNPASDHLYST